MSNNFDTVNVVPADTKREKSAKRIARSRATVSFHSRSGYRSNQVFENTTGSGALVEAMKECVRVLLIEDRLDLIADALNQTFRLSDEDSQHVLHVEKRLRLKD